jgi:hypothetical protein
MYFSFNPNNNLQKLFTGIQSFEIPSIQTTPWGLFGMQE